jgi:alpha-ketoglutaric semialdehyde dehydrogenase
MHNQNYIDGKWVDARSGATFTTINPANGEVITQVARSSVEDVNRAVEAATRAYPKWRATPAPKRGEILFRVGELLVQRKEELSRLVTREMGKVLAEGRGDVQEAIDMTYYMAAEGRRMSGYTVPSELPNKYAMAVRDPIGVVAAITPWNFPVAIPSWKITAALILGNTVVFKPASDTPALAAAFVAIFEEAGLPAGVLNLITGPGGEVGDALIGHPDVKLVSFTGSTDAGRHVSIKAAEHLKRVSLEMGGKNAIIVMDDADLDLAVEGIVWSAFGTSGQRCTAASRVIVHKAVKKELTDKLVKRVSKLRLGDGLKDSTDVGPVINEAALVKINSYMEVARNDGAEIITGGGPARDGDLGKGFFFKPTLLDRVNRTARVAQEEIFGPVTSIIEVDSLQEAIDVNNDTKFGLSSSIFTSSVNNAFVAMRDITTGIVYVNAGTIGAEVHLPFGGTRGTGNGHREGGQAVLDIFSEWKTLYVDFSGKLQRAQIDVEEI